VAEAKIVPRRARPLVVIGDGLTRLEVGMDRADGGAGVNRVPMVTFLLLGGGAGEADGRSFDNLPKSDTVPLLELVGG